MNVLEKNIYYSATGIEEKLPRFHDDLFPQYDLIPNYKCVRSMSTITVTFQSRRKCQIPHLYLPNECVRV